MELGYFHQSKTFWPNNRLDMNDARAILTRGDSLIFWCVGINASQTQISESKKRAPDQQESESDEENELLEYKKAKKQSRLSKRSEGHELHLEKNITMCTLNFSTNCGLKCLLLGCILI